MRRAAWIAAAGAALLTALPGRSAAQQQTLQVDTVVIEGAERQRVESLTQVFGIRRGDRITYRNIRDGIKALWSTNQFKDVRVEAVGDSVGPVRLVVHVEEQPLLGRVVFEGLDNVNHSEVRDTSRLRPGLPYSPQGVVTARRFIQQELASKGIPFARIEERTAPMPEAENQIELVFDVEEGQRVIVADVRVTGNDRVPTSDIVGAMGTRPEGFWWFRSGAFDESRFREDLDTRLVDLYESRGFLDFEILSDTVLVDPNTGKARIEIAVDEGPRYRVAEFAIEGNRVFPTDQLEGYYGEESGGLLSSLGFGGEERGVRYFDRVAFQDATSEVERLYRNEGYLYAQVDPYLVRNDSTDAGEPTVSVGWTIRENDPAYIRKVEIQGNEFTYDRVVRERLFLLPGDVYSEQRLLQSYQQISALGFFETPVEFPTIQPDPETGEVDITFHVKERNTGAVNFGTAVGGGVGVSGFLGYDQPNLFGQGKEGHLRWDFGSLVNNFTVSYTDPAIAQSRVSGTLSLFNARNRFFQFSTGRYTRLGGSAQVGFPLFNSIRTRVLLGYSWVQTKYDLFENVDDTSLFGRPDGVLSTFSLGVSRNNLNHPLFPTSGSRQSLQSEYSLRLLGGDAAFSKHLLEGQWYVPAGQVGQSGGLRFTLGLKARLGAIVGNAADFPFERFWMGGVQFGEPLRGYDETSITPVGFVAENSATVLDVNRLGDAFASITAEYAVRFNDNLSLSLFYDAGNVWQDPADIDPSRLFRGAGVGVQVVTPFGPLGLDYAYGFDKPSPGWQLHFRLGPGF
ncbi:MAG: outer membrane protein assembly factor BamA [Gemmatimonadota bacterium]|nr:outer membrane protein assembly factor BamA [Gemmatimonadota bacterium]